MKEASRQLVHLSGLFFIILAQFFVQWLAALYFFLIALTFLAYSFYIKKEEHKLKNIVHLLENKIRETVLRFERKEVERPFVGAFWFYFSCGLAFLIFPLQIATLACLILAISDSLSTIFGKWARGRQTVGNKTASGSIAFFISALIISLFFVPPLIAVAAALTGTIAELIPDVRGFRKLRKRGLLDDNLLIPILTGIVLWAMLLQPLMPMP
jgi:dolichol kinase